MQAELNAAHPAGTPSTRERSLRWWMLALIAIVAIGVYANSLRNGFTYDDCGVITGNPRVVERQWMELWGKGYWPEWEGTPDILYRPLTIWTYAANQALSIEPFGFHLVNLILHALTSMLVALLAQRLLGKWLPALITGILFAIHPIHTEVVANVVGRAEILAAMWSLLALLIFLPQRSVLERPVRRPWWHGLLCAACFLLAIFCKETPVTLLGVFLFLDIWRWNHWAKDTRGKLSRWLLAQSLRYYLPLAVAFSIYMAMRLWAVGLMSRASLIHPMVNPLVDSTVTLAERIVTPFALFAKYVMLMVWPRVLLADYSAPSIMPTGNPLQSQALLGILLVTGGLLLIVKLWKSQPAIAATVVMLAFSYLLVANVIRIGTIFAERLFYFPSVFVLILFAAAAAGIWDRIGQLQSATASRADQTSQSGLIPGLRIVALFAAAIPCVLLTVRTVRRNPDWKDNLSLAFATAADNQRSSKALCWAGQIIVQEAPDTTARDFGVELLNRAGDLYPTNGQSYWELAKHFDRVGQLDKSIIYLAKAARFYAGKADTRNALQGVRIDMQQHKPKDYIPGVAANLKDNPKNPAAQFAAGLAAWGNGDLDNAEKFIRFALALDPTFEEARMELGVLRCDRGDWEEGTALMKHYTLVAGSNGKGRCQYIEALLKSDLAKHPESLHEAEDQLAAASALLAQDPSLPALRTLLKQKQASLLNHAASTAPAGPSLLSQAGER